MFKINNYCDYEMCKQLSLLGFDLCTDYAITQYEEDYVYDGDPSHPESHKKGDIEILSMSTINGELIGVYSMPSIPETAQWLRGELNIHFEIRYSGCTTAFDYFVFEEAKNGGLNTLLKGSLNHGTYDDAYFNAIKAYLNMVNRGEDDVLDLEDGEGDGQIHVI